MLQLNYCQMTKPSGLILSNTVNMYSLEFSQLNSTYICVVGFDSGMSLGKMI